MIRIQNNEELQANTTKDGKTIQGLSFFIIAKDEDPNRAKLIDDILNKREDCTPQPS